MEEKPQGIKPSKELQKRFAAALPRAIFFPLIKRQQPPKGVLVSIEPMMDIKPWPTEPAEEEPAQPMVFNKTFTFKLPKKDSLVFKRMLRRQNKVPRKLKKALKHVGFFKLPMEEIETENGLSYKQTVGFGPKDGYPCTKWVNRACLKLKTNAILIIERQFKDLLPQTS